MVLAVVVVAAILVLLSRWSHPVPVQLSDVEVEVPLVGGSWARAIAEANIRVELDWEAAKLLRVYSTGAGNKFAELDLAGSNPIFSDRFGNALALSEAGEFSVHAPRIETMQIPTDKIREVIGSGGKVIREIVEVSGAKVDINDEGIIKIASPNGDSIKKAYDMIWSIVAEPEEGAVYTGTVVKIVDFGAFVNFFGKRDGLVHVSQIENRRLNHPSDVLKEGQEVFVKLLGFDDRGKVRLAMKMVDQETGEEVSAEKKEEAAD